MTRGALAPSAPSPADLRTWGLDPAWSRRVDAGGFRWHVLDRPPVGEPAGTVLCVHGNPTWGVLWRHVLAGVDPRWRVVAVDQLGMGWSERPVPHAPRRFATRVRDLGAIVDALELDGPLVVAAHDWGGPIALGWVLEHPELVAGLVLCNTGVAVPAGRRAPGVIRFAASPGVTSLVGRRTRTFVDGTIGLSWARLAPSDRAALRAPYRSGDRRRAIAEFVADIPLRDDHPSADPIAAVAEGIRELDLPALLLWGARDPVFDDSFAADLSARLPRSRLHRFAGAGHLVPLEADVAGAVDEWLPVVLTAASAARRDGRTSPPLGRVELGAAVAPSSTQLASRSPSAPDRVELGAGVAPIPTRLAPRSPSAPDRVELGAGVAPSSTQLASRSPSAPDRVELGAGVAPSSTQLDHDPLWGALSTAAADPARASQAAVVEVGAARSISFADLHEQVERAAAGWAAVGLRRGERVAVLVPPGIDLVLAMYSLWRAGGVPVVADRGLGLRGLRHAVRAAHVDWVVGPPRALAAVRALRWAPRARQISVAARRVPGSVTTLEALASSAGAMPAAPDADDLAAVLHTSGATGPAKGVRYLHGQIAAQVGALRDLYGITPDDRLVAAFAPFALYGPALGIPSTIPDVDVTRPGALTAAALAEACAAIDATVVFASPAALANVVRTASGADRRWSRIRLVLSAGAPVPISTLRATRDLFPAAELHTPYGMTECLPVADVGLDELEDGDPADARQQGVCVGAPLSGVDVTIAPLGFRARSPIEPLPAKSTGEVLVRAPWCSQGYDGLWATERAARPADADGRVWHRTGDVGHLDPAGRLWIEGRTVHVIDTVDGPATPVPVEVAAASIARVRTAAAVGVGPAGCQQLVVVVAADGEDEGLASEELTERVRAAVRERTGGAVAAVLARGELPVDIRHGTKIDRTAVARWAARVLAGR